MRDALAALGISEGAAEHFGRNIQPRNIGVAIGILEQVAHDLSRAAAEHEHPDHEDPGIAGVPGGEIRDRLVEVAVGRLRPTGDDPGQGEEDLGP